MTIEATTSTASTPRDSADTPRDVARGDEFTAVVSDVLETWRVVAVLGIRVLAERVGGGERRSFTLRFVRLRLSALAESQSEAGRPDAGTAPPAAPRLP